MTTASHNIHYTTQALKTYFETSRTCWAEFYPSEKHVLEYIAPKASQKVIDMGCACGGLARALNERFGITSYTGVDINAACIEAAKAIYPAGTFLAGDFLDLYKDLPQDFDIAFSLSCADWNVETTKLMSALFSRIKDGGQLVMSVRVTNRLNKVGIFEGRQLITDGQSSISNEKEYAPYKVYRLGKILSLIHDLKSVGSIYGYGYWGAKPETVEGLELKNIFYLVFAISKDESHIGPARTVLNVSADLFDEL